MPVRPGSDGTPEPHMIYLFIHEAFYHKEFVVKCPLDLNICRGIIGYRLYGVKQIARDQLVMRTYQL